MYSIPAGTKIETHRLSKSERPKQRITEQEMYFDELHHTGYNGAIVYFRRGDVEIAVNKNFVNVQSRNS